jgi:exodeoxyribonuclease III
VSWNVASWPPAVRNILHVHGSLAAFFDALGVDVVALQEVKIQPAKVDRALACVPGFESAWAFSAPPKLGYSGVTTYARAPPWAPVAIADDPLPLEPVADHLPAGVDPPPGTPVTGGYEREGRVLETDHGAFVLLNLYAPNAGDRAVDGGVRGGVKAAFLTAVRRRVDALMADGRQVIVCGDFNVCASDDDTVWGLDAMGYSPAEAAALAALVARGDLVDAWRATHRHVTPRAAPPGRRGFTVWDQRTAARSRDEGCRIDFFLVSTGLTIVSCDVVQPSPSGVAASWSDHAPLALVVEGAGAPPGAHPPARGSSACDAKWLGDARQPTLKAVFARAAKRKADGEGGEASKK